ncbi:MAG: Flp pilus assembly complex ATPase component TadA [Opitutaceae bacterium]|nr:Flp pilus assembly complex ATPase component TadA [Opitutaceae bacterium]
MNEILRFLANEEGCFSDAHVEQGRPLRLRKPTGWEDAKFGKIEDHDMETFLQSLDKGWEAKMRKGQPVSVTIDLKLRNIGDMRYRCFAYTIDGGTRVAASMRPIRRAPDSMSNLGLPPIVHTYAKAPKGLLLISGPTGSGKTTTIMAILSNILKARPVHVVTIEDPIEYVLDQGQGITSQREVGVDTQSYAAGLKEALRQRPDVIMVGEIRDQDTASTALRAAESGHFVVATMHSRSAIGAIQKLREMSETDGSTIGYSLIGVLAQVLVPSKDKSRLILASELLHCQDREIITKIGEQKWPAIEDAIKRGDKGCLSMGQSLTSLVRSGQIERDTALAAAYDPLSLPG